MRKKSIAIAAMLCAVAYYMPAMADELSAADDNQMMQLSQNDVGMQGNNPDNSMNNPSTADTMSSNNSNDTLSDNNANNSDDMGSPDTATGDDDY